MKKFSVNTSQLNLYSVGLFCLIITGFFLRVYQLDSLTLWVDEYVHVDRARFFPAEPLFTNDNNGILLTMFIIPFFKLFAATEFWARFPSVIFGTLSIPLIYVFARKYFNKNVGLLAATLMTFSQYLVFWSRISRNYVIFSFFFLLFLYFLGRCLNVDDSFVNGKNKVLNYLKCQPKYLLITLGIFILAILSHQLAFLVVYGICFYHLLIFIYNLLKKEFNFLSINAILSYVFFIFSVVIFIPEIQAVLKSLFALFLPARIVDWVLPDLGRLSELMEKKPYDVFQIYWNVLKHDYTKLYWLGTVGFIFGIIRYKKSGFYIAAIFILLFVLMSFIFREPALPRYLIYIYPLFLVSIALTFDSLLLVLGRVFQTMKIGLKPTFLLAVCVILVCVLSPVKSVCDMVVSKEHGRVCSSYLSAFYFPDWKNVLTKVKNEIKENDVLITTMPTYVNFYLGRDSYQFRQRVYDTKQHRYVNMPVDTLTSNARSLEALQRLYEQSDRGWLMADYYFNNVMTDPQAKAFVIKNMNFRFGLSNNYVSVFSWDKNVPKQQDNAIVEHLSLGTQGSAEYRLDIAQPNLKYIALLDIEGLMQDNEVVVHINGKNLGVLRKYGELFQQNKDSYSRQNYYLPIPENVMKQGANSIRFFCNELKTLKNPRFVVYNFMLQQRLD